MNVRKKPVRKLKSGIGGHADLPVEMMDEYKEPDTWTIVTAMNRVLEQAEDSRLSDEFWESVKNPLAFLRQELGLTDMQIVVVAIMIEIGEAVSWKRIGNYLGCTRLSIMVYSEEIEELVAKRWLMHKAVHEFGGRYEGFKLVYGVVTAIRHNKTFVPEKIDGLTEQQFVDKLEQHIDRNMNDHAADFKDDEVWMQQLVKANPHLPLCHEILQFDDIHVQSLLLMIVYDYAQWEGSHDEGLTLQTIGDLFPADYECDYMRQSLQDGTHILMDCNLIEFKCEEGQVKTDQYMLTRKAKAELLSASTRPTQQPTAIQTTNDTPAAAVQIYDLQGTVHQHLTHGLNIVRQPDGTIRKVLVK